jgi:hypothetical protein
MRHLRPDHLPLPINLETNSAVPPFSLADHLRINVFPQFSTIVYASASPYVPRTCAIDRNPST